MGMNATPSSERLHIAFLGMRNAGKSSLMNRIAGQDLAVVSPEKGTTTDPVRKSMELLPLGPVVLIDTPGLDDEGTLGELRTEKARKEMMRSDAVVIVIDGTQPLDSNIRTLIETIRNRNVPYLVCISKADLIADGYPHLDALRGFGIDDSRIVSASAEDGSGIEELKRRLSKIIPASDKRPLVRDLFDPGDAVMLVIPIDESAPKGRLILPQQQTIRDILEGGGKVVISRKNEVCKTLSMLVSQPRLVITDSQAFGRVAASVPQEIPLTSFSILFSRCKGTLDQSVRGVSWLLDLKGGERILISEGCTHHRQCGDIGSVKIPGWIRQFTGKDFDYSFTSGGGFPDDLGSYSLIIHCGGCMLTEREMGNLALKAEESGVPFTNYGMVIAFVHGILPRSLSLFPQALSYLQR